MPPIAPSIPPDTPLSKLPNFDPRVVPVFAVDSHLPAVARAQLVPAAVRQRFALPPAWQPEVWAEPRFTDRRPAAAAVLVPIVMRERPMVLLTERATHLATHSGQVAFPGGKCDPTDVDAADTALREATEEIGLDRALAEVIGHMPTYLTGTMFTITPVVALVRPDYRLRLNAGEVADAFEVPLEFLMNPAHHRRHAIEFSGVRREWFSMPYMDDGTERFIWGATAAMLRNFYRFLAA
ncbi:MAG: mismatch repair protein MutT [Ramlibacter sp.]|jgi:8-oxo-dGTP pyrophosphatase MutT (NUDIX family)|uniref:CoA pyrophosphatase n=1 Tax=Ramlibacter sp. TaxID=1917967 RepID=UPI002616EE2E|nr:CoA pyrophosphatase [Ramlibacter sp.]MDB5751375.1 mismatch repair protein MutT [Ramlibacter sp.]